MGMRMKRRLGAATYHAIVGGINPIMIYPLVWTVMSSFKEMSTTSTAATNLTPETLTLENYANGWEGFAKISSSVFFKSSLFTSVLATVGTLCPFAIVAFGFVRYKLPGKKFLLAAMLASMMLPAQVFTIPQYLRYQKLHWVSTYLPPIVPYCSVVQGFFVYVMTNFIEGIPTELDESAKIDGCSYYGIFLRIVLPLSKPVLITGCIFSFTQRWSDFLGSLLYTNSMEKYPVSLALKLFSDPGSSSDYSVIFAMAAFSTPPTVLIFLFLQRYLVEGVVTSGTKGQEIIHNDFSSRLFCKIGILRPDRYCGSSWRRVSLGKEKHYDNTE